MEQQLHFLRDCLEELDNNPHETMKYYTFNCRNTNNSNIPTSDCRWLLIQELLHKAQHIYENNNDCGTVDFHVTDLFSRIEILYQTTQHLCWTSHSHHFHPSFRDYINCPVTCITEICEYLKKILKERFHS